MQPKHPRNLGVMRRVARSCLIAALALVAASTASLAAMLPIEIRSGLPWASGSLNSGGPFEAWRGGRVEDVKTVFFGINDWQHMAASAGGLSYRLPQYQMIVALGMLPRSSAGQLAQCAAGQFDTQISAVTNGMLANGGQAAFLAGRPIIIRLGWEANNTKGAFPWRIVGNGFTWRDCFRRWVDILDPKVDTDGNPATPPQRTGRFRIVWNMANKGTFEYPINNIWPGNDYVDIVGSEFYDRCPTVKNGDEAGWRLASNGRTASGSPVGPVAWLAFARSKGKKYAVPEWGIGGPNTVNCGASQDKGYDNPFVVRKMFEFFTANAGDIAFEAYFNGHGYAEGQRGSHMIFDPEPGLPNPIDPTYLGYVQRFNPKASAMYRQLWGGVAPIPPASNRLYWLRYIASYPDLIASLGADPAKGQAHYAIVGRNEARKVSFRPLSYLAYPDLKLLYGTGQFLATKDYILTGYAAGRSADPVYWLRYIASYPDLITSLGANPRAGEAHYAATGATEGRVLTFNPATYLAANPDLSTLYGTDYYSATLDYILTGFTAGRPTS
ncbi:MAG: hypothetical protein U1E17_11600 [Geminicoccaceae bacterium]